MCIPPAVVDPNAAGDDSALNDERDEWFIRRSDNKRQDAGEKNRRAYKPIV